MISVSASAHVLKGQHPDKRRFHRWILHKDRTMFTFFPVVLPSSSFISNVIKYVSPPGRNAEEQGLAVILKNFMEGQMATTLK